MNNRRLIRLQRYIRAPGHSPLFFRMGPIIWVAFVEKCHPDPWAESHAFPPPGRYLCRTVIRTTDGVSNLAGRVRPEFRRCIKGSTG